MTLITKLQAAPSILLVFLLEISIAMVVCQLLLRHRRLGAARSLASQWKMRFSSDDRFGLAEQLVEHLPEPGAANLCAADLIYQWDRNDFFCAFTVTFTQGAIGSKHRRQRVAGMREAGNEHAWIIAPPGRSWSDQYAYVRERLIGRSETKEPGKE